MVTNENAMSSYTVFKTSVPSSLPPNYHLKKNRQAREEQSYGFDAYDSYTPTPINPGSRRQEEEEDLYGLFRKLNEKLFGKSISNREDAAPVSPSMMKPDVHSTERRNRENEVPPQICNNWWNLAHSDNKVERTTNKSMVRDLHEWCQTEYDQTREIDKSFYTPQELRDRISAFKEIHQEFTLADLKNQWYGKEEKSEAWSAESEESEPWDLVTPLPLNAKGLTMYDAMEEESYRNTYYSSTVEMVA